MDTPEQTQSYSKKRWSWQSPTFRHVCHNKSKYIYFNKEKK